MERLKFSIFDIVSWPRVGPQLQSYEEVTGETSALDHSPDHNDDFLETSALDQVDHSQTNTSALDHSLDLCYHGHKLRLKIMMIFW